MTLEKSLAYGLLISTLPTQPTAIPSFSNGSGSRVIETTGINDFELENGLHDGALAVAPVPHAASFFLEAVDVRSGLWKNQLKYEQCLS